MKIQKFVLALAIGAFTGLATPSAMAQWQWIEKDGSKVYSDRPPPPDIPEKNILKQPGASRAKLPSPGSPAADAPADAAAPAVPAASAVTAPKPSGVDKELEAKKKQAEAAEEARKKAEEAKQAKLRADNCVRAKQGKAALESGVRIAQTNAQGERIIMDDAARAAEAKRMDAIIATDCK